MGEFPDSSFSPWPPPGGAMNKEKWAEQEKGKAKWAIRIEFALLHSQAYQELKYAPAIKTLNWFYEKVRYKKIKYKRGEKRYQMINEGEISFTYREAGFRGLTQNQFSRALKALCHFGFIDVIKHGSGLEGDYTIFSISNRWKHFGTPEFEEKEFPDSAGYGYRDKKKKQRMKPSVKKRLILLARKR